MGMLEVSGTTNEGCCFPAVQYAGAGVWCVVCGVVWFGVLVSARRKAERGREKRRMGESENRNGRITGERGHLFPLIAPNCPLIGSATVPSIHPIPVPLVSALYA